VYYLSIEPLYNKINIIKLIKRFNTIIFTYNKFKYSHTKPYISPAKIYE